MIDLSSLVFGSIPSISQSPPQVTSVAQITNPYAADTADPETSLPQITSVTQLSDVQPTDWAYQAMRSLVERYGCIIGYPDKTYRGDRALTRYEFAAGLNACLDKIQELLASATADLVRPEDLGVVKRLQDEFASELALLRGRVDGLETRVAVLEQQQFSTTTKLTGTVLFVGAAVLGQPSSNLIQADLATPVASNNQATLSDVVLLNLNTTFPDGSSLTTQLQAFNLNNFAASPEGFAFLPNSGISNNSVTVSNLAYNFSIGGSLQVTITAIGAYPNTIAPTAVSPVNNSILGAATNFSLPPQYEYSTFATGAGAALNWTIGNNWIWNFGYVASNVPNSPVPGAGLFNGPYTLNTQLNYSSPGFDINLYYANAYTNDNAGNFLFLAGYNPNLPGRSIAQVANIYATQFNFKFGRSHQLNLGGGFSYIAVQGVGARLDYDGWSWQVTGAVNDFLVKGNQLGLLAGVPPYTRDLPGQSTETGFITELYYRWRLNDNIAVTPSLIWQVNPYNVSNNSDAWIGTIRTTFNF